MKAKNLTTFACLLVAGAQALATPFGAPVRLAQPTAAAPSTKGAVAPAAATRDADPPQQAVQESRPSFDISPADGTFRGAIGRWARTAGWTFGPEHWTLGRDIPVVGSAALGNDFQSAVRTLTESSEMTDLPVKACFYSNSVIRVIPLSAKCDRTVE